jgi:SAM-dependent methyltransferase
MISKVDIRPVTIKEKHQYQITEQTENKALHRNIDLNDCLDIIRNELLPQFKQAVLFTTKGDYHLLTNKKGETAIKSSPPSKKIAPLSHNRQKNYILPENQPLPFLIELGLMNPQGKVYPQKMAKFRQINRFLEMVEDTVDALNPDEMLSIIDFGCGKAYLTFALYHYFNFIKKWDIHMVGIDLKKDVIEFCSQLANRLKYKNLKFSLGDIASYVPEGPVSMVVALHACDTATDAALAQAIQWKSQVILAAPCCQHELYKQVMSESLKGILQFGLLKERFAALATDAARAQILEMQGYATQILEFIDPEETPKNILIRAVRGNSKEKQKQAEKEYLALKSSLQINPTLEHLIDS